MPAPSETPNAPQETAYEAPDPERPATAATTEPELHRAHDPYSAFRFLPYSYYAIGNFASVVGRQMLSIAVEWEIYQRTHSAAMLGIVGLVLGLPIILFAIPAGHLADKFSRKHILLITQSISACTSLGLAAVSLSHADIGWIYVMIFISGTARAFGWAARSAFMATLVPIEHLNNAVTWGSSTFQIGSVVGPAAAGLLLARVGFPFVYTLDAFCALLFFVLLLLIPTQPVTRERRENAGLEDLFSGLRFVWKTKIVLATITLDLFAVLFGGATALLPIYADKILHIGAVGLGWMRAAPSLGAIVMGFIIAYLPPMQRAGKALLFAVIGFGVTTILFGISHWPWFSMLMLALVGAFDNVSVVVRHTLVQLLTPDVMRGRVSAVNNVFIGSSNELGAFESGMTAHWFGPVISVVGGGIATILVVLGVARAWPEVVRLSSFASVNSGDEPQES